MWTFLSIIKFMPNECDCLFINSEKCVEIKYSWYKSLNWIAGLSMHGRSNPKTYFWIFVCKYRFYFLNYGIFKEGDILSTSIFLDCIQLSTNSFDFYKSKLERCVISLKLKSTTQTEQGWVLYLLPPTAEAEDKPSFPVSSPHGYKHLRLHF